MKTPRPIICTLLLAALTLAACAGERTAVRPAPAPAPASEANTVPPPPPPGAPMVAQAMLEGQRIAGNPHIQLPDTTLIRLGRANIWKVQAKVKMCLDPAGVPESITFKKSLGDAEGDAAIRAAMSRWRYRPYHVAGKPVAVCFTVIFNYKIEKPRSE